ncbi:hypothetical protein GR138_12755 [Shinella kummerowiae]|uniref:Putative DnaT-like domain-containing protein n=1 Tax=Shinella kummerowiae TaxID=417745 RepID=A0A6N8SBK6_9HYPH|nr:DnaT-like ssDNA-binding protein [Shinella kummerowiae]MXN46061.1 hypothetical protein [Shinella kummerowiae]
MAGYGGDSEFNSWLTENGYALPVGASSPAVLRNRGSQYIDAVYGSRFLGSVVDAEQERQWPREGAIVNGKLIPSNVVPVAVTNASYYAAYQEAVAPGSLSVIGTSSSAVKRVKVGQIEKEYQAAKDSDGTAASITPLISIVDGMLAPYLKDEDLVCFGIWSVGC